MSRPRFPVSNFADVVTRPGATNHAGALDLPRRVAALERLAAVLGAAAPSNGCVRTSDTTQTGGVKWLARTYGKAARTSAQSISNAGWNDVTFSSSILSSGVTVAASTVPLTCVTAGPYDIKGHGTFTNNGSGIRLLKLIHKNSSGTVLEVFMDTAPASASAYTHLNAQGLINMSVGDFLQLQMYQDSGAALNTNAETSGYHATISMALTM